MENEKNTGRKILDTAKTLFEETGAEGVTMREIASGSGIALGTIYNYYANKDQIILALVAEFWERTLGGLEALTQPSTSFSEELNRMYIYLYGEFFRFQADWIGLLRTLSPTNKEKGLHTEEALQLEMCQRIRQRLLFYYPHPWKDLSRSEFAGFLCDNLFSHLVGGKKNIDFLLQILTVVTTSQEEGA